MRQRIVAQSIVDRRAIVLCRGITEGSVHVVKDRQSGAERHGRCGPVIVCSSCRQMLTNATARTMINGSHEHTFDNPHGVRFRIGCFAWVSHCEVVMPASIYWSWFPGHAWQVEVCSRCGEHLGWLFRSADSTFHGLILDRLMELDQEPD